MPERFTIAGRGATDPIADNDTPADTSRMFAVATDDIMLFSTGGPGHCTAMAHG